MKRGWNVVLVLGLIIVLSLSIISASVVGDFFNKLFGREPSFSPDSGLINYYKFDGSGGDSKGAGGTAAFSTSPKYVDSKKGLGQGVKFNGNGDLAMINLNSPAPGAGYPFTTCFWFNWQGNSQGTVTPGRQSLVSNVDWPSRGFWNEFNENSGQLSYHLLNNGENVWNVNNGILQKNEWYHSCVSYGSSSWTAYLNGVKVDSKAAGYRDASDKILYLGGEGGRYFNGILDDLRIYSGVLSASQIKEVYDLGNVVEPINCKESDGGKNYYVNGTTWVYFSDGSSGSSSDSCHDYTPGGLYEYFCDGGTIKSAFYDCASEGKVCNNGACTKGNTTTYCTDSDGGANLIIYGTATDSTGGLQVDSCVSTNKINESLCDANDRVNGTIFDCPTGTQCSNGACTKGNTTTYCTDSDGGANLGVYGSALDSTGKLQVDSCTQNPLQINESQCDVNNRANGTIFNCPSGTQCSNGVCAFGNVTSNTTCIDSDGGKNIYINGTILKGPLVSGTLRNDICVGDSQVRELFCNENGYGEPALLNCPEGTSCVNGACVNLTANKCLTNDDCAYLNTNTYSCSEDGRSCVTSTNFGCVQGSCVAQGSGAGCTSVCTIGCDNSTGKCINEQPPISCDRGCETDGGSCIPYGTRESGDVYGVIGINVASDIGSFSVDGNLINTTTGVCTYLPGGGCFKRNSVTCSNRPGGSCSAGFDIDGVVGGVTNGEGTTIFVSTKQVYCSFQTNELEAQKQVGNSCNNGYECLSDACVNGQCALTAEAAAAAEVGAFRKFICGIIRVLPGVTYDECVGTPLNLACTDSDGGLNYAVKGFVNNTATLGHANYDYCISDGELIEGHCLNTRNLNNFTTQYFCNTTLGFFCTDGACVNISRTIPHNSTCVDTDNGTDVFVKGSVSINGTTVGEDTCIGNGSIDEYFCKSYYNPLYEPPQYWADNHTVYNCNTTLGFFCTNGACVNMSA